MPKWKHKSQEEKEELHREMVEREKVRTRGSMGIAPDFEKKVNDSEQYLKVFKDGGLPMFCPKHGWVSSKKYKLREDGLFGVKYLRLSGNCEVCNADIAKALNGDMDYLMMMSLILPEMVLSGRLVDERRMN